MEFSPANTLSVNVILSDVLSNIDDLSLRKFNHGTYLNIIQQALEQLSFHTLMLVIEKNYPIPATLSMAIPQGCLNLKDIYVYSGDCCDKGHSKKLWWKDNYRTQGQGYISNVMENTRDPFLNRYSDAGKVFFYGIENGIIYFSPSCAKYEKTNIIYNGLLTNYGDTPFIPIQLRRAVVEYATMICFRKLKAKNPKLYTSLYKDAYVDLYDKQNGSWADALLWTRTLDSGSRECLLEYLQKAND